MKIAFITFEYPPFVHGGAGVYADNLTRELAKLGHEIHVITTRVAGSDKESNVDGLFIHRLRFINKPFLSTASFWFFLRKEFPAIVRQVGGFDIVHGNGVSDFSLGQKEVSSVRVSTVHHLSQTTIKALKMGLLHRIRNIRGEVGIVPFMQPIYIRRADRIIAVSQFTRQNIIDIFGISESKTEVIHHGVHPGDFIHPEESMANLRNTLGIKSLPMILFVGRLSPRKGTDVLLKAMPHVLREMEVKLVLAGSGNQQDYQQLARTLGISDKLSFLGRVPGDTLRLLYSSCDLFVLPSRLEGLGIVILEAMAAGKPIVATNVGGIPELIESGQNGILVEADEEEKLASAIIKVLSDNSLARAIGENNKKEARECYSWEVAARKTESLYNDLVEK
ncbi:glycosyltransferase family 4 protein [Chloroflexota bacterium]